jgi:hypothetical protein
MHHAFAIGAVEPALAGSDQRLVGGRVGQPETAPVACGGPLDRILVLVDGTVEAVGTHEELIGQAGRYADLFELQAAGYR